MRFLLFLLCILLCCSIYAAEDEKANNPSSVVNSIAFELGKFSGRSYPVFVRPNPGWAEARDDGTIVIDLKIVREQPKQIAAFLLAHEWGHQMRAGGRSEVTGDQFKIVNGQRTITNEVTMGKGAVVSGSISPGQIGVAMSSREEEREADRFAVKFMVCSGYDVEPFVKFLLAAPDDQRLRYGLHTHDTKETRAKFIRDEYKNLIQRQENGLSPTRASENS